MNWHRHHTQHGGSAPATPGFTAVAPEWLIHPGAADAAPAIPAAESTLGSHPCVALYSAQVLPEWTTSTSSCNDLSSNGDNPLNFVSHYKGSLQFSSYLPLFPTMLKRQSGLSDVRVGLLGALTLRSFDYCRSQSWLLRYSIPACTRHQLEAVKGAVAVDVIALFHVVY